MHKNQVTENKGLAKFFEKNIISKDYFDKILIIRETIKQIEQDLINLKFLEFESFKEHYENTQNLSPLKSVESDLIYSALFGV